MTKPGKSAKPRTILHMTVQHSFLEQRQVFFAIFRTSIHRAWAFQVRPASPRLLSPNALQVILTEPDFCLNPFQVCVKHDGSALADSSNPVLWWKGNRSMCRGKEEENRRTKNGMSWTACARAAGCLCMLQRTCLKTSVQAETTEDRIHDFRHMDLSKKAKGCAGPSSEAPACLYCSLWLSLYPAEVL